jgi:uridine kinase
VAVVSTDLLATWEHPLDWWPIVERHLLGPIAAGRSTTMPVTEWVSGKPRPGGAIDLPPVDVLILEGVSSGRRAVADRLSALVWVEVPGRERRLARAVARDGESMRTYLEQWQTGERAHFDSDGTRARADVILDPS